MKGLKLYEVDATLGVRHLVAAKSTGDATQTVARSLSIPQRDLSARKVSDLDRSAIIRSSYPDDDA
jgi:hypothetical protein